MASYPAAEDEKRLLAHAAETATAMAADGSGGDARHSKCRRACRRRMAGVKKAAHFTVTLAFVVACCVAFFGLSSLAVGTIRHARATSSCTKHGGGAAAGKGAAAPAVAVVADAGSAGDGNAANAGSGSGFARLLEAVSPESLHDLLHEYFPDTYKHGVYPSEKQALEAIHRANAALATSIVQLARRDLNGTVTTATTPTSTLPTSSAPKSPSSTPTTTTPTTTAHTGATTSAPTTTTGSKVTSVYTSTINGTPTVVTATTVVGVGATSTGATATNAGTLQTGAAAPVLGSRSRVLAVAGAVVGALLV